MQLRGEEEDQQQRQPEVRHPHPGDAHPGDGLIDNRVAPGGGQRAQRQPDGIDQERGGESEHEAIAAVVAEEIPDRLAGDERGTQVPAGKILQIDAVLHPDRLVEPEPLPIGLADLLGHGRTEHAGGRVARSDAKPIEDGDRRHHEHDRRAQPTADKIGAHVLDQPVSTVSSFSC